MTGFYIENIIDWHTIHNMKALSLNLSPVSRNIGCASDVLYHCRIRSTGQIAWVPEGSYKPTVPIVIRIPGQLSLRSHNIVIFFLFWNKTAALTLKWFNLNKSCFHELKHIKQAYCRRLIYKIYIYKLIIPYILLTVLLLK